MAIRHTFQSAVSDGADATLVQPSDWNDDHDHVPFTIPLFHEGSGSQVLTNLAAGPTEFVSPRTRQIADLTHASEVRVMVNQSAASSAGSWVRVQYSVDGGGNWDYLDGVSGPTVDMPGANVSAVGAWVVPEAAALDDVLLRVVAGGGDGVADPSFWAVHLQVR